MASGTFFKLEITRNELDGIAGQLRRKAQILVAKTAEDLVAETQGNIRRLGLIKTGFMINSVKATKLGPFTWEVGIGADYWIYLEFGTTKRAGTPFFIPAIENMRMTWVVNLQTLLLESSRYRGGGASTIPGF